MKVSLSLFLSQTLSIYKNIYFFKINLKSGVTFVVKLKVSFNIIVMKKLYISLKKLTIV